MQESHRQPVLDGLRAISILLVLAGHMLPLGPKWASLNAAAATMGMSLFFSLSGFLIATLLLKNPDVVEFAAKRLGRILPLVYAYTLVVFTIFQWNPEALFWTATFLANYKPEYLIDYNAHLWSLCVEVQFYVAIALAVLLGGRKAIWIVWPACLAVTALRITDGASIHIQTHLRVDEILVGCCVATLHRSPWRGSLRTPSSLLLLAAVLWLLTSHPATGWLQYLRPYATGALLALTLSQGENSQIYKMLASAWMKYIATISYALYVFHPLTIHGWMNQGGILERYLLKRPVSFALTFLFAHLSTFYWERPCQVAVNNWIVRRRQRFNLADADRKVIVRPSTNAPLS